MKKITKDPVVDEVAEKMKKMSADELNILILDLLYLRAKSLFDEKKYDGVIRIANEALKKDPEAKGFLAIKFRACKKLKRIKSAKRILKELVRIDKIDQRLGYADNRFDWSINQNEFYDEAVIFLDSLINGNIKEAKLIELKSVIFSIIKKYPEMIKLIDWIYAKEPKNHRGPILKEYLLYLMGKNENVIANMDKIIKDTKTKSRKVFEFRESLVNAINRS